LFGGTKIWAKIWGMKKVMDGDGDGVELV